VGVPKSPKPSTAVPCVIMAPRLPRAMYLCLLVACLTPSLQVKATPGGFSLYFPYECYTIS
jgi:hypothetical protein